MEKIKELIDQNRLTNCFTFRDEIFENLKTGKMKAHIVDNVLFLFQVEELGFYKFYYFVNDLEQIELAKDLLEKYYTQGDVSLEFTTKRDRGLDELRLVLERLGFCLYDRFEKFLHSKENITSMQDHSKENITSMQDHSKENITSMQDHSKENIIKPNLFAKKEDVQEIYEILTTEFNPITDAIPSILELEKLAQNKSIFIEKDDILNKIIFIQIFEFHRKMLYGRLTWLKKEYRNAMNFISFANGTTAAMSILGKSCSESYFWCSIFNRRYRMAKLFKDRPTGVSCNIFTYKKERIIKNKRKKYESKTQ